MNTGILDTPIVACVDDVEDIFEKRIGILQSLGSSATIQREQNQPTVIDFAETLLQAIEIQLSFALGVQSLPKMLHPNILSIWRLILHPAIQRTFDMLYLSCHGPHRHYQRSGALWRVGKPIILRRIIRRVLNVFNGGMLPYLV